MTSTLNVVSTKVTDSNTTATVDMGFGTGKTKRIMMLETIRARMAQTNANAQRRADNAARRKQRHEAIQALAAQAAFQMRTADPLELSIRRNSTLVTGRDETKLTVNALQLAAEQLNRDSAAMGSDMGQCSDAELSRIQSLVGVKFHGFSVAKSAPQSYELKVMKTVHNLEQYRTLTRAERSKANPIPVPERKFGHRQTCGAPCNTVLSPFTISELRESKSARYSVYSNGTVGTRVHPTGPSVTREISWAHAGRRLSANPDGMYKRQVSASPSADVPTPRMSLLQYTPSGIVFAGLKY